MWPDWWWFGAEGNTVRPEKETGLPCVDQAQNSDFTVSSKQSHLPVQAGDVGVAITRSSWTRGGRQVRKLCRGPGEACRWPGPGRWSAWGRRGWTQVETAGFLDRRGGQAGDQRCFLERLTIAHFLGPVAGPPSGRLPLETLALTPMPTISPVLPPPGTRPPHRTSSDRESLATAAMLHDRQAPDQCLKC